MTKHVYDVKIVNASLSAKPKDFYNNTQRGIPASSPKSAILQALRHIKLSGRWEHIKIEVFKLN